MPERRCGNCEYFESLGIRDQGDEEKPFMGLCRRYPPPRCVWSEVTELMWCGEFKEKEASDGA
jgi:hypothetical protein